MPVLVDTSVWINYFRGEPGAEKLDLLIDENLIVINDLILAELVPFLEIRKQRKPIQLLFLMSKLPLDIDWDQIVEFQLKCLKNGINGIGIPDLILAQNAKRHGCQLFSLDNHFELMKDILDLELLD
jgi:predicted nucleic acid-binding protein